MTAAMTAMTATLPLFSLVLLQIFCLSAAFECEDQAQATLSWGKVCTDYSTKRWVGRVV